jgi:hypothetical protein
LDKALEAEVEQQHLSDTTDDNGEEELPVVENKRRPHKPKKKLRNTGRPKHYTCMIQAVSYFNFIHGVHGLLFSQ